jgi:hypothetical protein
LSVPAPLALPPIEPLRACLARLEAAGVPHALGGSGLLAALGLVDHVNDWDVNCDADLDTLASLFAGQPHERFGNSGCHADHKLNLEHNGIELIARFAFFVDGGVVRIPTKVTRRWRELPVGSPEGWAVAYALMGELEEGSKQGQRVHRAELLFTHIGAHGADAEAIAFLLAQPLPAPIAGRLAALPRR